VSGLVFKEFSAENIRDIAELYNYYIVNSTANFYLEPLDENEILKSFTSENPKYQPYIIFSEGVLCGYVMLCQFRKRNAYDDTAEISLYLKPGYTGKGIGSVALKFIEEKARLHKLHTILGVICGENTQSIRLFEKNGYTKCGHLKEVGVKFGRYLDVVTYQKII